MYPKIIYCLYVTFRSLTEVRSVGDPGLVSGLRRRRAVFGRIAWLFPALWAFHPVQAQILVSAGSYGVLGASTVTNTGSSLILGDLGVSPGTAIAGFSAIDGGPGSFTGALSQGNAAAAQAETDAQAAYTALMAMSPVRDLSGLNLGGLVLTPGVYKFDSSAQLTGTLTLDAQGNSDARFVFEIGSTLTTASDSTVDLINLSPNPSGPDSGLFFAVGSSATIGTDTAFAGTILANTSITLDTGASIQDGRAIALHGAVTLDDNRIDARVVNGGFVSPPGIVNSPVPEPSTYALAGVAVLVLIAWRRAVAKRDPSF